MMNVYVYENRTTGKLVYSMDNYTYEEMNEKNLNGGNIMDAQDAILRKILTKFIEGRDDSFTRRMYDYRPETALQYFHRS